MTDILTREADLIKNAEGENIARLEANKIILEDGAGGGTSYSTDEKKVGNWIDGRTIYRKVIPINVEGYGNTWMDTGVPFEHFPLIVNSFLISKTYSDSVAKNYPCLADFNNTLYVMHLRNSSIHFDYAVLDYVKEE